MRTVLRHQLSRKPFVTVANEVARDERLSYAARGVLIAMLSRPTNWAFSAERLAAGSPRDGRKSVLRHLKELEAAGYLFRYRERAGNLVRTITVVSDTPIDDWQAALTGSPETAPPVGSPHFDTPGTGTPESGTPYERQRTKDREETQIPTHPSIPLAGQDQERRNPDSAAPASAPTGVAGELDLAEMDGWRRDRRRRKPWADLQDRYERGELGDEDVVSLLGELLDGLDPAEERTAIGMLGNDANVKAIYNTIRAQRRTP
jgi:hypothetical protein